MKEKVNWEEIEQYIDNVNDFYKDKNISGVYGLARGGLIFAVMLSHKMNIPLLLAPTPNCIIIDDICDSGESLIHYTTNRYDENKYYITTMYYNKKSSIKVDYYMKEKENKWIVYPWEEN